MTNDNDQIVEEYQDDIKDRYLTFEIDNEVYGIEVANIREIISFNTVTVTLVPQCPPYVIGIMNLRGDIVPVINVRRRFQKPQKDYDDMTCIVVIEHGEYSIGLVVDNINEVVTIGEENIMPPPSVKLNYYNHFIRNIGKTDGKVKLLLDLEKFLEDENEM